jgi:hypothetical protein
MLDFELNFYKNDRENYGTVKAINLGQAIKKARDKYSIDFTDILIIRKKED